MTTSDRHLSVVSEVDPAEERHRMTEDIVDRVARRYWHRATKTGTPRYDNLPDEHMDELRDYVRPMVLDVLADALDTGLHRRGSDE